MTRTINAHHAGACRCSRTFGMGARITLDANNQVVSCYDCSAERKANALRRLHAALDPTLDATRSRL